MVRFERGYGADEYRTRIAGFSVHVKRVEMFAAFLRDSNVKRFSNGELAVAQGYVGITYGAGPCIAGLAVLAETPYLFHFDPTQFRQKIPLLLHADAGLIGGGVDSFLRDQNYTRLENFGVLGRGTLSVLIQHKQRSSLDLLYMLT